MLGQNTPPPVLNVKTLPLQPEQETRLDSDPSSYMEIKAVHGVTQHGN